MRILFLNLWGQARILGFFKAKRTTFLKLCPIRWKCSGITETNHKARVDRDFKHIKNVESDVTERLRLPFGPHTESKGLNLDSEVWWRDHTSSNHEQMFCLSFERGTDDHESWLLKKKKKNVYMVSFSVTMKIEGLWTSVTQSTSARTFLESTQQ